jgi:hypothetical protein
MEYRIEVETVVKTLKTAEKLFSSEEREELAKQAEVILAKYGMQR